MYQYFMIQWRQRYIEYRLPVYSNDLIYVCNENYWIALNPCFIAYKVCLYPKGRALHGSVLWGWGENGEPFPTPRKKLVH